MSTLTKEKIKKILLPFLVIVSEFEKFIVIALVVEPKTHDVVKFVVSLSVIVVSLYILKITEIDFSELNKK